MVLKVCSLDQQFPGNWLDMQILQPHPRPPESGAVDGAQGSLSQQAWQVFLMPARVREPQSQGCSAHPPDSRAVRALAAGEPVPIMASGLLPSKRSEVGGLENWHHLCSELPE